MKFLSSLFENIRVGITVFGKIIDFKFLAAWPILKLKVIFAGLTLLCVLPCFKVSLKLFHQQTKDQTQV